MGFSRCATLCAAATTTTTTRPASVYYRPGTVVVQDFQQALEAEAECELTTLHNCVNNSQDDPSRVQNRDILSARGLMLHNLLQKLSCVIHSDLVCSFQV